MNYAQIVTVFYRFNLQRNSAPDKDIDAHTELLYVF